MGTGYGETCLVRARAVLQGAGCFAGRWRRNYPGFHTQTDAATLQRFNCY